jgi:small subunit ribosomal protein S15
MATTEKKKTTTKKVVTKKVVTQSVAGDSAQWFQRHDQDTGSPEYQINLLTTKITTLQEHLKINHKDFDAKRSLLKMVAQRRTFLRYLKTKDLDRYLMVSKKTGLKV